MRERERKEKEKIFMNDRDAYKASVNRQTSTNE